MKEKETLREGGDSSFPQFPHSLRSGVKHANIRRFCPTPRSAERLSSAFFFVWFVGLAPAVVRVVEPGQQLLVYKSASSGEQEAWLSTSTPVEQHSEHS